MILSMTGFGSAERDDSDGNFSLEIKSLNHRFFEAVFYLPEGFRSFEEHLRTKLAQRIKRGRLFIHLQYQPSHAGNVAVNINKKLAQQTLRDLRDLSRSLKIEDNVTLKDLILIPNIVISVPSRTHKSKLFSKVNRLFDEAINNLIKMRIQEGTAILKDLNRRLINMQNALSAVEAESPRLISQFKGKIRSLLGDSGYNSEKLVEEVGVFCRNVDISEETVRLRSHFANFRKIIFNKSVEKGRTLDFIAQEIQREINTLGAKSASINISKQVVTIKSEVDRIREQLSNVE